jgi:hypothetical protein
VFAIGAHDHFDRAIEPVDAVNAVAFFLHERERAGRNVPAENGDGAIEVARRVHVTAVGANRDRSDGVEPVDSAHSVLLLLDEGERTRRRVSREHRDRIVGDTDRIHVRSVGTHRHAVGDAEAVDAADAVFLLLDERQRTGQRISTEHGERVVGFRRHVEVRSVGAERQPSWLREPVNAPGRVPLDLDQLE